MTEFVYLRLTSHGDLSVTRSASPRSSQDKKNVFFDRFGKEVTEFTNGLNSVSYTKFPVED